MHFQGMAFKILLKLVHCMAKRHHARMMTLEQWLFEIKLLQGFLKETVIISLKGTAANLVRYMGS